MDQLVECNVIIDHYTDIAVQEFDQNYVKKLKLSNSPIIAHLIADFGQNLAQ